MDATRDVGDRERPRLAREHRVDHDLEQQVAELVLEPVVRAGGDRLGAAGRVDRKPVDRLRDLVRLFEQMADERVVRLFGVPGAAAGTAQSFGQRDQRRELAARSRSPRCRRTPT